MMRSLFSGVAGIRNHQTWLDIIGNNISNVNTVGFKNSRATFAEALAQTLRSATGPQGGFGGNNPMQVGLGMQLMSVDTMFKQGAFETTGNNTDLALQGSGFFVVSDGNQKYFTRSGAFSIDADGYLTAQGGTLRVQGLMANQLGAIANNMSPSDIQIPFGMKAPAHATENLSFFCNLDAEGTESDASLTSAGTTGVTSVSGTAVNGAGGTHTITITGDNATQSTLTGAATGLAGTTTLGDLGVTDFDSFTVTIDGVESTPLSGLNENTTMQMLADAIDNLAGVSAEWDSGTNQIVITSDQYGSGTTLALSACEITTNAFGTAVFEEGDDSTLVATDSFQPSTGGAAITTALTLEANDDGLITGLEELGGGGVTILAPESGGGLAAGTLVIDTEDTAHSTSIVTYDSLGGEHVVTFTFTRTAQPNVWAWEAGVEEPAQTIGGNTGSITFNDDGSLQAFNYDGGVSQLSFNPNNGANGAVTMNLDPGEIGGVGGITQFAAPTTTIAQTQDGYGMGNLSNIYIDQNGAIIGAFSNDQNITLAQIIVADFHNPQGLLKEGGNLYRLSANSGDPIYGMAQTDLGSSVHSGYVEMSNVELSKEFADMIIAQRGFQASARVITTADQMLEEVVRLKR
ncbi:MAG: flagellar hook-basal body complex protein [Candidatus Zixiibacteriota bacterium]|nr:MAG: flagellar hook-basal body complex protein [candidate division Zixibacteria bacterium]